MMEWNDYDDGYSLSRHYEVFLTKDVSWAVYLRIMGADNFVRFSLLQTGFATREEAKQWCEMYEATGGME